MLTETLRQIENARPERSEFFTSNGRRSSATQMVPDKITCPACLHEQEAKARALDDLISQWDEHWARLLEQAGGYEMTPGKPSCSVANLTLVTLPPAPALPYPGLCRPGPRD